MQETLEIIQLRSPKSNVLNTFPKSEYWRLGMEVTRQNEGPEAFHRGERPEPGYMLGIRNAFDFIMRNIEKPLSADMLATIHDICVQNISEENIEKSETSFRDDATAGYSIELIERDPRRGYFSKQGFIELFNKIKNQEKTHDGKNRFFLEISTKGEPPQEVELTADPEELYKLLVDDEQTAIYFYSRREKANYLKERVQQYINDFYHNIANAKTNDQKLDLIILLVKDLEQLHPFPDANGRTISMITLNKLLIEHGFSPVMLDNPNRIDGMSTHLSGEQSELREEIIRGMKNFNDYSLSDLRFFLQELPAKDYKNKEKLNVLQDIISNNPLTAMAQISAIFQEISKNKISIKTNSLTFFGVKEKPEKKLIMQYLEGLYQEKVEEAVKEMHSNKMSEQVFNEIVSNHAIPKNNPTLMSKIVEKLADNQSLRMGTDALI